MTTMMDSAILEEVEAAVWAVMVMMRLAVTMISNRLDHPRRHHRPLRQRQRLHRLKSATTPRSFLHPRSNPARRRCAPRLRPSSAVQCRYQTTITETRRAQSRLLSSRRPSTSSSQTLPSGSTRCPSGRPHAMHGPSPRRPLSSAYSMHSACRLQSCRRATSRPRANGVNKGGLRREGPRRDGLCRGSACQEGVASHVAQEAAWRGRLRLRPNHLFLLCRTYHAAGYGRKRRLWRIRRVVRTRCPTHNAAARRFDG